MANLWCWYLAKLLISPLRRRIWPMEAVYDLSVAHNHMTINQRKDTHRDALKRDKTQSTRCSLMHSLMSTETNTVLTISWHHTQHLPAKVLIFLWQTWHLVELPSALIQSWAANWHTEEQKKRGGGKGVIHYKQMIAARQLLLHGPFLTLRVVFTYCT